MIGVEVLQHWVRGSYADKPAFYRRGCCSRRKPSHLRHIHRCVETDVAEAVVESCHKIPDPNRPFVETALYDRNTNKAAILLQ